MCIEPRKRALLVGSHHSAVTGHVAGEDGRKPSFDPLTSHEKRPDLACLQAKCTGPVGDVSIEATMSALGQKQTLEHLRAMSALPPKADMDRHGHDVRFVPKADIKNVRKWRFGSPLQSIASP